MDKGSYIKELERQLFFSNGEKKRLEVIVDKQVNDILELKNKVKELEGIFNLMSKDATLTKEYFNSMCKLYKAGINV